MIYVKIGAELYPATIDGKITDREWDGRESKAIHITSQMSYTNANKLFPDGVAWSIVEGDEENQIEHDNSAFSVRGDIIVHTDGTCTIKMGKPTDLETAYEMIYGGM